MRGGALPLLRFRKPKMSLSCVQIIKSSFLTRWNMRNLGFFIYIYKEANRLYIGSKSVEPILEITELCKVRENLDRNPLFPGMFANKKRKSETQERFYLWRYSHPVVWTVITTHQLRKTRCAKTTFVQSTSGGVTEELFMGVHFPGFTTACFSIYHPAFFSWPALLAPIILLFGLFFLSWNTLGVRLNAAVRQARLKRKQ